MYLEDWILPWEINQTENNFTLKSDICDNTHKAISDNSPRTASTKNKPFSISNKIEQERRFNTV